MRQQCPLASQCPLRPSCLARCRLTQRWEASLWLNGRQLYLGGFNSQAGQGTAGQGGVGAGIAQHGVPPPRGPNLLQHLPCRPCLAPAPQEDAAHAYDLAALACKGLDAQVPLARPARPALSHRPLGTTTTQPPLCRRAPPSLALSPCMIYCLPLALPLARRSTLTPSSTSSSCGRYRASRGWVLSLRACWVGQVPCLPVRAL